jgi:hypothetical protein
MNDYPWFAVTFTAIVCLINSLQAIERGATTQTSANN